MSTRHSPLTAEEVIAGGGWHPRYARVIALASDDGYGFALVDGNGDGSELEAEAWTRWDGTWECRASSGAGPLDGVGPTRASGEIDETAWFAYGSAPGPDGTPQVDDIQERAIDGIIEFLDSHLD